MRSFVAAALLALVFALVFPAAALAATTAGPPFPTNPYTRRGGTPITGPRGALPQTRLPAPPPRSPGGCGADGKPLEGADFRHDLNFGQTKDPDTKAYRKELLDALPMVMAGGATPNEIAAASLFTTQSIDATSRQIRAQLGPGPASFT